MLKIKNLEESKMSDHDRIEKELKTKCKRIKKEKKKSLKKSKQKKENKSPKKIEKKNIPKTGMYNRGQKRGNVSLKIDLGKNFGSFQFNCVFKIRKIHDSTIKLNKNIGHMYS